MKRILIVLLTILIAAPLILGGVIGYSYSQTGVEEVPQPGITIMERTLSPAAYEWHAPVWNGVVFKDFSAAAGAPEDLGTWLGDPLALRVAEGYASTASLQKDGTPVWSGTAEEIGSYTFTEPGSYRLDVQSDKPVDGKKAYGTFYYAATFTVNIEPEISVSADNVSQGDVLAIQVSRLFGGVLPTAESTLENLTTPIVFFPVAEGTSVAFVPIMHNREAGEYTITVTAGEKTWTVPFTVSPGAFPRQDLTIDTTDETISEANSPAAYQQFRDKIHPLYDTADPEKYWEGVFITPAEGRISTAYGLFRYTNGSTTPSRHAGIDIAADENAAVVAPNAGKVVFAEYLLNTGNTIVIEHGGGLKSYFFHMDALSAEVGQMVEKGQPIGLVGGTGYSTAPHLHYEVRIGNQTINPTLLTSGESALYYFE